MRVLPMCLLGMLWSDMSLAAGAVQAGRDLAIKRCARCHVIGDYNRMGGIGSTPSFPWLTVLDDYEVRVRTFYTRPPHPVFTRVEGYARWSDTQPYVAEFAITEGEIENILSYIKTLKPNMQPARAQSLN